jgi:hypothetical protein
MHLSVRIYKDGWSYIRTLVRPDNNNHTILRVNPKVFIEMAVRFVVGLVVEEYLVQVYLMLV